MIMGSGKLAAELRKLADLLLLAGLTSRQTVQLHLAALEELVHGLGARSTRHVMSRADLLIIEVMMLLADGWRNRYQERVEPPVQRLLGGFASRLCFSLGGVADNQNLALVATKVAVNNITHAVTACLVMLKHNLGGGRPADRRLTGTKIVPGRRDLQKLAHCPLPREVDRIRPIIPKGPAYETTQNPTFEPFSCTSDGERL